MNDVVSRFAEFLAGCWEEAPTHSYRLPARGRLAAWRDFNSQWDGDRDTWVAHSLREALEKYFWPPTGRAVRRGLAAGRAGNFASNREELNDLRDSLLKAIQTGDEHLAKAIVYRIFDWGGVSRRRDGTSRTWIRESAQKSALCSTLSETVRLLKKADDPLNGFRTHSLLMNSSMTKVYALADPEEFLIIYDGRVGGALGHLARVYLTNVGERTVPEGLSFRWGGIQPPPPRGQRDPRNPSAGGYVFPRLFNVYSSDLHHAEMVRRGSLLVSKCVGLIPPRPSRVSPRELEAALFMWGYRVN